MLTIQMPDGEDRERRERRRRLRAAAYLIPLVIFVAVVFIAASVPVKVVALAAEIWLLWAVRTDPRIRR